MEKSKSLGVRNQSKEGLPQGKKDVRLERAKVMHCGVGPELMSSSVYSPDESFANSYFSIGGGEKICKLENLFVKPGSQYQSLGALPFVGRQGERVVGIIEPFRQQLTIVGKGV